MGLIVKKEMDNGITIDSSYVKVSSIQGDKTTLLFAMFFYNSLEDYRNGKPCVTTEMGTYKPLQEDDSKRWDKQIYKYLKTLDSFSDSIDVLEEGQTP